ncbi:dTDP-4-amino-4,6-dideoxygalactose transaminase [Virgibacillus oceani]
MIGLIPFYKPCVTGKESVAMQQALANGKLSGNGSFGNKCTNWLEERLGCEKAILTPSCTDALEMTALLMEIRDGDEVIMPSYTFVSSANAYALWGASIRFIDVDPLTMNMDADLIEAAVTERTKAIVAVHYAGVSCDTDKIMDIAERHHLFVIEDAAQALMSTYKDKPLGTIGHFGTFSFHDTKNYTCGEGGALLINDPAQMERAEILQEKGTDRSKFVRGQVDKYTWQDIGSSYLLSEINAAFLSVQFEQANVILEDRMKTWEIYRQGLKSLSEQGRIEIPYVPANAAHNAHMFFVKAKDEETRNRLMDFLADKQIQTTSHYVPLHNSVAGRKYGKFIGEDKYTTADGTRILRLPLYYEMGEEDARYVIDQIQTFYKA